MIVAAALLLRRDAIVRIIGIVLVAGTLGAFFMSRNLDNGIFGFTEKGCEPSPQAALAFIAEIVALVVLAASFVAGAALAPAGRGEHGGRVPPWP